MTTATIARLGAAPAQAVHARLLYLDGWRGLSIALVLIGHFLPVPGINLALLGVEFFFVLSGRLMAEILFIENYPLKAFFKRRFSRIYPALLVFVLAGMVFFAGTFVAYKWKAALTALTFTYNYVGILINRAGALDHIWSLCVEEHAYVALALISVLVARRRLAMCWPRLRCFRWRAGRCPTGCSSSVSRPATGAPTPTSPRSWSRRFCAG